MTIVDNAPVHKIKLSEIDIPPARGRRDFSHVPELARDIKERGLINPILVRKRAEALGRYLLVAGECRLRAHLLNNSSEIQAKIVDEMGELEGRLCELSENVARKDLDFIERAFITEEINRLRTQQHGAVVRGDTRTNDPQAWSASKTAEQLGVSEAKVSQDMKIVRFLKANPQERQRLSSLGRAGALREIERIAQTTKAQALLDSGQIKTRTGYYREDALSFLKSLPSDSVHCLLTDPPFGIDTLNESDRAGTNFNQTMGNTDNLSLKEVMELMNSIFPELHRVLIPGSHMWIFFCFEFYSSLVRFLDINSFGFDWVPIIWFKQRTTAPFLGYRAAPCYEPILHAWKPDPSKDSEPKCRRLNEPINALIPDIKPVDDTTKLHPFEKPLELGHKLVKVCTMIGDTVLDPFAGSGAFVKAAIDLGRTGLGCEISEKNYALGVQRFDQPQAKVG